MGWIWQEKRRPRMEPKSISEQKRAARAEARARLAGCTPEDTARWGEAMFRYLQVLPVWNTARTVMCFMSMPSEPDTRPLLQAALRSIPSLEVQRLFHSEVCLADWLLQYEARKNRLLISQITMLAFEKAPQRIARLLLCLYENYGQKTPNGTLLNIRFTCTELAAIANTSRVTSNNTMLNFIRDGILAKEKSRYIIRDVERLREIADRTEDD